MAKYYAGIGSRKTPKHILELMADIGEKLRDDGYILRSGGADGADLAFTMKINREDAQIFLPWNGFNNSSSNFVGATDRAFKIAESIHPAWNRCSQGARKLHARNVHQVLGWDINKETYSEFVICWTPDGKKIGGTATAIELAEQAGITIVNLAIESDLEKINNYMKED